MTTPAEEGAPPKLFEHCITVFEQMKRESSATEIEGSHALVYEGFLTRLFSGLELATPYYTSVMQMLRKMGCVRQLSRGGGASPSKWELLEEPTLELFEASATKKLHDNTFQNMVLAQLRDISQRVHDLEAFRDAVISEEKASL